MIKYWLSIFLLFGAVSAALAQGGIKTWANPYGAEVKPHTSKKKPYKRFIRDTLQLPFVDDFSAGDVLPDLNKWVNYSGVRLNDNYAVNPISRLSATFDGANSKGIPYSYQTTNFRGQGDSLESLPIDLSGVLPNDPTVWLSFYWQSGTPQPQNNPDFGDSLVVQFLDDTGQWWTVWSREGFAFEPRFKYEAVQVNSNNFFHNAFQFRFYNVGNNTASNFDIFSVDYVLLNIGRDSTDSTFSDVAYFNTERSLLKDYNAMPFNHFIDSPRRFLKDSIIAEQRLMTGITPTSVDIRIRSYGKSNRANPIDSGKAATLYGASDYTKSFDSDTVLQSTKVNTLTGPLDLRLEFLSEDSQDRIAGNDTIYATSRIDNYYSYSDNTAELTRQLVSDSMAYPFRIRKQDTLTSVSIYFVPGLSNAATQYGASIYEYNTVTERPGSRIAWSTGVISPFEPGIWNEVRFLNGVVLDSNKTYLLGLNRMNGFLFIGCDVNMPPHDTTYIYDNQFARWDAPIIDSTCSYMVRFNFGAPTLPADTLDFRDTTIVIGVHQPQSKEETIGRIYPNPSNGIVNIEFAKTS